MERTDIDVLLQKYLDRQCTPEELRFVLDYIGQPDGVRHLERLLQGRYDAFEPAAATPEIRSEWYQRVTARTGASRGILVRAAWIKYAAAVVIGIVCYTIFFNRHDRKAESRFVLIEKTNGKGQRAEFLLPDSTDVVLGADSRLKYPENFNGDTRLIELQGEAFFDVRKHSDKPFIVRSGGLQTRVLGTSFMIKAFDNQEMKVAVATGKVRVDYADSQQAPGNSILEKGQALRWNPLDRIAQRGVMATEEITAWKNGRLTFADTRLSDIVLELEHWYDIQIRIEERQLKDYTLSLTIDSQVPVTHALDAITAATNSTYKIEGHRITIR